MRHGPASTAVSVVTAGRDMRPTLVQLTQLCLYDLSAVEGWDVDEADGFGDALLRGCWTDQRRHPYLIRAHDRLAGFAIVDQGSRLTGDPSR